MGIETIQINEHDREIARISITNTIMMSHLGRSSNLSFQELVRSLNMEDIIEQMIESKACDKAWIRYYQNTIHNDMTKG